MLNYSPSIYIWHSAVPACQICLADIFTRRRFDFLQGIAARRSGVPVFVDEVDLVATQDTRGQKLCRASGEDELCVRAIDRWILEQSNKTTDELRVI